MKTPKPPDGKKAFKLTSAMEQDLSSARRVASALYLIAESNAMEKQVSDALFVLAGALENSVDLAEEKRDEVFRLTSGYAQAYGIDVYATPPAA